MNIRGLSKTSLVDYPGRICAVVFTSGCNMRCPFCHNPELALGGENLEQISSDEILRFLEKRRGLIDGITITGGEPSLQPDLQEFMKKVKEAGLLVKLDSNGLNPGVISGIVKQGLADYFAIDVKSSPAKYSLATGVNADWKKVRESIEIIRSSGIDYEIRTTCVPGFVTLEDMAGIGEVSGHVKSYYLQQFVNHNPMIDPALNSVSPYPVEYLEKMQSAASPYSERCVIRGA